MNKDIIVVEDEKEIAIFHYKAFCELLVECISIYGNTTIENAQQLVKNFYPIQHPIESTIAASIFAHEPFYYWAMLARYGEMYWLGHPEREEIPDSYQEWLDNALARYGLDEFYDFIDKQE